MRRFVVPGRRLWPMRDVRPSASPPWHRPHRVLIAVAALTGVLVGAVAAPTTASAAAAPGYTLVHPHLIGETPLGYTVYVGSRAAHAKAVAATVSATSRELRHLGLPVTYAGFGSPAKTEGIITVTEGQAGCAGSSTTLANTSWSYKGLPNGDVYMYRSDIVICPKLYVHYPSWERAAVVRHEFGHAMGLGHTDYGYAGSYQVMNAVTHSGVRDYRSGDVVGLRRLAAGAARVRAEIPPTGRYEQATSSGGKVTVIGWALLRWYRDKRVAIDVTDNGRHVPGGSTTVYRADVNRRYDRSSRKHGFAVTVPRGRGTHTYCVTAVSTVNSKVARAKLGCATFG